MISSIIVSVSIFRFEPGGMKFKLMYQGSLKDVISAQQMTDLIRSQRPGITTPTGDIAYPVGQFFLILDTMTFTIQTTNKSEEEEGFMTPPMPTTTQPMFFGKMTFLIEVSLVDVLLAFAAKKDLKAVDWHFCPGDERKWQHIYSGFLLDVLFWSSRPFQWVSNHR